MGVNNRTGWLSAILRSTEVGLVASLVVILGLIYALGPPDSFFTRTSLLSLLQQIGLYGILAIGAAVVIISGGIDLSVGAVVALSSVFCAKLLKEWLHDGATGPPPSGVVVLAIGLTLA